MRRMAGILAAVAVLWLGGCERQKAAQPALPPPSKLAADAADSGLLAAAEPFEALTEAAFSASWPTLDRGIATAIATAEHVKTALPAQAQRELNAHLDAIAAARRDGNRAGVALGAMEIYRLFASHAPPEVVPREVNLLRYVALRYDADLRAHPRTGWDDMVEAAAFGQRAWAAIQGRVADVVLRDRMSKALADMAAAAAGQNAPLAVGAERRELEVVTLLEAYFSERR
ncbi:MAG: hypothetical protein JWQ97_3513 [Phenylobacterium sp.]|nr:hypothetical protein [Phenylobacterium sp.]